MGHFAFTVVIEADSRQEAERKLLEFQTIVSNYKKYTINDLFGDVIKACSTVAAKSYEQWLNTNGEKITKVSSHLPSENLKKVDEADNGNSG